MSVAAAPPQSPPPAPGVSPSGGAPSGPSPAGGSLPEPPRGGIAKRLLLGCVTVLLASAATSAVLVSGEVQTLRKALSQNPSLQLAPGTLASAGWGDPQTLLLVGDDQRALTKYYHNAVLPHANEMLLVRIDPSKPYISMMSIPRELQVTIDAPNGPVTTRFNYAYTAGGIRLLVSTIKGVLGLSVDHVMVITFGRFKRAVDEMGCVYSTIDRRYYHSNVGSVDQYQEINLQPGYQNLCGDQALQFVSYRHGDTSLVRDARDQSFLLDVKKQYGPTLVDNVGTFEQIFGQAVQTDPGLHTTTGVLNLLGTLISSSGRRVRQVQFQANLLPTYDTATAEQITASVRAFLYGGSPLPKLSTATLAHAVHRHRTTASLPLVPTASDQVAPARAAATGMPFPFEYPRVQAAGGSATPVYLRDYLIHAPDGTTHPVYVAVFAAGLLGQYYDVQGMSWTTAPQFGSPDQTVPVAGRTYFLYYEGQHLKMVAWYERGAVYWIRNSLTDSLENGQLLAIAEQTEPLTPALAVPGHRHLRLRAASVPVQTGVLPKTGLIQTLGSLGGFLTLAALPLLAIPLIKRRRELVGLRAQLRDNLHLEARLSAGLAGAGISAPAAVTSPSDYSAVNVFAKPPLRLRGRVLAAAGVVIVTAFGLLGVLLSSESGHGTTARSAHDTARSHTAKDSGVPAVPVAVLNASSTQGAARDLAQQLRLEGVRIASVGNLAESRPAGLSILYAPGARAQAVRLARLLARRAPTTAPIDAAAQATAGSAAQIVVVIA